MLRCPSRACHRVDSSFARTGFEVRVSALSLTSRDFLVGTRASVTLYRFPCCTAKSTVASPSVTRQTFCSKVTAYPSFATALTDKRFIPRSGTYKTLPRVRLAEMGTSPVPNAKTFELSPRDTSLGTGSLFRTLKSVRSWHIWSVAPESMYHIPLSFLVDLLADITKAIATSKSSSSVMSVKRWASVMAAFAEAAEEDSDGFPES